MTDNTMTIPMAMSARSSERTRALARRMLETAADATDISQCGMAAVYVASAYIALIDDDATREATIRKLSDFARRLAKRTVPRTRMVNGEGK